MRLYVKDIEEDMNMNIKYVFKIILKLRNYQVKISFKKSV